MRAEAASCCVAEPHDVEHGNAVATVLIATWTRELDREQLSAALSGSSPFDEATMLDDDGHGGGSGDDDLPADATNAGPGQRDAGDAQRDLAESSLR